MIKQNVKFTHNSFEYYELYVTSKTETESIYSKLENFKRTKQENNNIVLSFADDCGLDYIEKVVDLVKGISNKLGLFLHSIKSNDTLKVSNVLDVVTTDFPFSKSSRHIYNKTIVVNEPIRSGVRVQNDGDIIVASFVSNGAEVIATGNIHVYGELRGKAIAGSAGDKFAKIFCAKFNPELISIGGIYRAIDTKLPGNLLNNFVMVSLDEKERLKLEPLSF